MGERSYWLAGCGSTCTHRSIFRGEAIDSFFSSLPSDQLHPHRLQPQRPPTPPHIIGTAASIEQAMALVTPLEISEIMDKIASYLDNKTLARCARVSKFWHTIFLPRIWRVVFRGIEYNSLYRTYEFFGPPLQEDIYKHRHLIHDLYLFGELAELDKFHYPNLRDLQIDLEVLSSHSNIELSANLSEMAPLLVTLYLGSIQVASTVWESLPALSHITELILHEIRIEADDTPWLWETYRKLKSLELDSVTIKGRGAPKDIVFDRLLNLELREIYEMNKEDQLRLIFQSPNLQSLNWDCTLSCLKDRITQKNRWPNLRKLHIACHTEDTDLTPILEGIGNGHPTITDLYLSGCSFGTQTCEALRYHFVALVKVDLSNCIRAGSSIVLDLLCCCPRLEILKAREAHAEEIAKRGPWVCHQLRELKIGFRIRDSDRDLRPLIFERLSTLTQLQELGMWSPRYDNDDGVLEFQLEHGMWQLASLQQLSSIHFHTFILEPYYPQLGMEEVAWIRDNWKKLRWIKGYLNSSKEINAELVKTIKSYDGINHTARDYY